MNKKKYNRLIELASQTDIDSTKAKILELNDLLSEVEVDSIEECHIRLLDDLISIMSNTNNIFESHFKKLIELQDKLRDKVL